MCCKIFHLRSFKITTVNWVRYRSVIPVDDNQNFLGMMTNVLKYRVVDKISSKVTGSSPSRLSWRNVSKYANLKSGTSAFALDWNNLLSAQSLISFWQNRLLPMPAFRVTRTDSGCFPSVGMKISWELLICFPLIWPYWRRRSFRFTSRSLTGFLPCCMRMLVNMWSVLILDMVGEAWAKYSVWLFIDSFNASEYSATAGKKTVTCIYFHKPS